MTTVQTAQADYPYLTLDEIRSLSKEIRGVMVEKGWYETERTREEVGMLIASEVFEAFEEYRDGNMDTYFTDAGKPCGCWSEIADVAIRCLDAMDGLEQYGPLSNGDVTTGFFEGVRKFSQYTHIQFMLDMATGILEECQDGGSEPEWWGFLLSSIVSLDVFCKVHSNTNLRHEIALKMTYNRTRPHRHGGKRL